MSALILYNQILDKLLYYCHRTAAKNKQNLTDQAIFAEQDLARILSILFKISISNTNVRVNNTVAVDLKDAEGKMYIQVTTRGSGFKAKKDSTIKKFLTEPEYDQAEQLVLIFFTTANIDQTILAQESIRENCVYKGYDFNGLMGLIRNADEPILVEILKLLDNEIGTFEVLHDLDLPKYPAVANFISRPVTYSTACRDLNDDPGLSLVERFEIQRLNEHPLRVLLKAEAALGKSVELQNLAHHFSDLSRNIYPVFVPLVNYTGNLDDYLDRLFAKWKHLRPRELLLLFDGIDDIPGAMIPRFIKEFNVFIGQNKHVNMVASIRSNVATPEIGMGILDTDKLMDAELNELTLDNVNEYLRISLDRDEITKFKAYYESRSWVKEVVLNPFYLSHFADLVRQDEIILPDTQAEMLRSFISLKNNKDKSKYGGKVNIPKLNLLAEKMALYLTLTGYNSLAEDELSRFTDLPLEQVRLSSLFRVRQDQFSNRISFVHNNFQEYLCAAKLLTFDWEGLESTVFHSSSHPILKPKMVNTVNFLFTLMPKDDPKFKLLLGHLMQHNKELILQFERAKIDKMARFNLFKSFIETGRQQKINWLHGMVKAGDLVSFLGKTVEGFKFLLDLLAKEDNELQLLVVLELMRSFPVKTLSSSETLQHALCNLLPVPGLSEDFHNSVIYTLNYFEIFNSQVLDTLKTSTYNNTRNIRGAIIKYIRDGKFHDQFHYVMRSDIVLISGNSDRMNLKRHYMLPLIEGLTKKNTFELVNHFVQNFAEVSRILDSNTLSVNIMSSLYRKLVENYLAGSNPDLFEKMLKLTAKITRSVRGEKTWGNICEFFILSGTKQKAFESLLRTAEHTAQFYFSTSLYEHSFSSIVTNLYRTGAIDFSSTRSFRNSLRAVEHPGHDDLQSVLCGTFPGEFEYPMYNFQFLEDKRKARNFDLLLDKSELKEEAKRVYDIFQEENTHPESEFYLLQYSGTFEQNSRITSSLLFEIAKENNLEDNLEAFDDWLCGVDWDDFVCSTVHGYLKEHSPVPLELIDFCRRHLREKIVPSLDIRKAFTVGNYVYPTAENKIFQLVYFYQKGLIVLPEHILLDLLYASADSGAESGLEDEGHVNRLYTKIFNDTDSARFRDRVITNLGDIELLEHVLAEQVSICKTYGYRQAVPILKELIQSQRISEDFKEELILALQALGAEVDLFESIFDEIGQVEYNWHFILGQKLLSYPNLHQTVLAKLEASLDDTVDRDAPYWRQQMLIECLRQGSKPAATLIFVTLSTRRLLPDYWGLLDSEFEGIIRQDRQWIIDQCFNILPGVIGDQAHSQYDLVSELLEKVIRRASSVAYYLVVSSLNRYEELIKENASSNPYFNHIHWYKIWLIRSYYASSHGYESEQESMAIVEAAFPE